jgi:endonuclease/exonuclease/phosphatase family metal-dependent hydrolase
MKTFKIATYNTCFGMKSNSAWSAYNTTWNIIHGGKPVNFLEKRINFSSLFDVLEKVNPDVLVLNEIFDDLMTIPLKEKLNKLGYTFFYIGNSGHHEKPLCISTILVTKIESRVIKNPLTFAKGKPGSGGGAIAVFIPSLNVYILGCHLAFKKKYIDEQILQIDKFYKNLKNSNSTIILVGDFNRSPDFLKKKSEFGKEMKSAITETTFPSFFPFYKPLVFLSDNIIIGPVDNVYYNNATAGSTKVIGLLSDHKMAIVELIVEARK